MATAELADDATHEDIEKFVDQTVKDAEEDRKGEQSEGEEGRTDSQQVAEEHSEPVEPVTETKPDGEDAADEGEEAGDPEGQAQDWLDDTLKAEVAAYGIDEKELADFTSREEVERVLRFFDRNALEAGRKAMAEGEKGKLQKEPEPKDEGPKEGQYEIALDEDKYDEGLVEEFTRMRDHYDSRVAALETRFAEADARTEERHFDNLVDSLGHADLFGKSGKEGAKELQRREDLFVAVKAQQIGLQQLGRPTDLDGSLVNRVTRMVFAEELGKKDLKARTRKFSKQADGRMGGGSMRAQGPEESTEEWADRYYKELEGR